MSQPEAMSCAEAEPLLPLVADGALDPDSDPALFAHLASCPACQRAMAQHDLIGLAIRQAGPAAAPPRRAAIIRFWPYAAAAGLLLAVGLWLRSGDAAPPAAQPLASAPAPVQAVVPAPQVAAAPAATATSAPDVIAVRRPDGTSLYLVRQGDTWVAMDPAGLDGPTQPQHGGGSGVQVRY